MVATVEVEGLAMGKARSQGMPVRLTSEALRLAKIAAAFQGETIGAYCSRVVIETARGDIARGAERISEAPAEAEPVEAPKRRRK
jgi:hypothetical protein